MGAHSALILEDIRGYCGLAILVDAMMVHREFVTLDVEVPFLENFELVWGREAVLGSGGHDTGGLNLALATSRRVGFATRMRFTEETADILLIFFILV